MPTPLILIACFGVVHAMNIGIASTVNEDPMSFVVVSMLFTLLALIGYTFKDA